MLVQAPRSTSRSPASVPPNTAASAMGPSPPMIDPGASMLAPASRSASTSSTSSLLAAQCSGVSRGPSGPTIDASRSAPASARTATMPLGLRRWPGQSAKRWRRVRDPAASPSFTIQARARPGCLARSRRRLSAWPRCTAAVASKASGSFQRRVMSGVESGPVIVGAPSLARQCASGQPVIGACKAVALASARRSMSWPAMRRSSCSAGVRSSAIAMASQALRWLTSCWMT